MKSVGLDVHLEFCEVAIVEDGVVRSAGRVETRPERLEEFAAGLAADDRVALEVTGNAWEIARILEPHVAQVLVVSPSDTAIRQARAKTDRLDARTLARLLAAGSLDGVWMPDQLTWVMRRRLSRRSQLVWARSRAKNQVHAVLMRQLVGRAPVSDVFGVKGRKWLAGLALALEERETVDGAMRQITFLDSEIAGVEQLIASAALKSSEIKRLMSVPGVNVIVAATFLAAVGDIHRFKNQRKLVGYLGSVSPGPVPRRTATFQSKARTVRVTRWSRRAGQRSASPGPCTRSISGFAPAEGTPLRSSPPPASLLACSGVCSPASRTTRSRSHHSPPRNSGCSRSPQARRPDEANRAASGRPASGCAKPSACSPNRPSTPTSARSATGTPRRQGRWARARHRGTHQKGPQRAKPRGRPQAPDVCASLVSHPRPVTQSHNPTGPARPDTALTERRFNTPQPPAGLGKELRKRRPAQRSRRAPKPQRSDAHREALTANQKETRNAP